jgi:hypothetical protein
MNAENDRFLTDVEAAKILAVSPQTLRNYRHLGRGPSYCKKGRLVRYRLTALFDYMSAGEIVPEGRREMVQKCKPLTEWGRGGPVHVGVVVREMMKKLEGGRISAEDLGDEHGG